MKWEYTSTLFTPSWDEDSILNDLGEERWELAAMLPVGKTEGGLPFFTAIYKRPKNDANPPAPYQDDSD
jgi:hypothetical protein